MAVLILDAKTALVGAREGIELCIRTVIPSLFPFFLLSILLTGTMYGARIPWVTPICRLFRIPKGGESLLLTGFIAGYPVGAQSVSQAYETRALSKEAAERMIIFCNQCGPAFLFGMLSNILNVKLCWLLWGIQIISALLTALALPGDPTPLPGYPTQKQISPMTAMRQALQVMGQVCGWIILFRVLMGYLERWALWYFPDHWKVSITCLLEISNGCMALAGLEELSLRFVLCAGMLSFGGLCVMMQTFSVVSPKLNRRRYFPGKVLQCAISLILASIMMQRWEILIPACLIGGLSLLKIRKNSSIPAAIGV